jgi:hypothetical protein
MFLGVGAWRNATKDNKKSRYSMPYLISEKE